MWFWIIESLSFTSEMRKLRARAGSVEVRLAVSVVLGYRVCEEAPVATLRLGQLLPGIPGSILPGPPPDSSGQLHGRQRGFLATNRVASPRCIRGFCQRLAWSPSYRPCSSEQLPAR